VGNQVQQKTKNLVQQKRKSRSAKNEKSRSTKTEIPFSKKRASLHKTTSQLTNPVGTKTLGGRDEKN
jgi:hypothetical protein